MQGFPSARRASLTGCLVVVLASCAPAQVPSHPATEPGRDSETTTEPPMVESVSPSPRSRHDPLCQPFPDRLIDEFLAAYNGRDLEALQELVTADEVRDVSAAPLAGTAVFGGVSPWAEAGWAADDRFGAVGYGAFHPTPRGFQMFMDRRNDVLASHGIEALAITLDAVSAGCSIQRLEMSGFAQAQGEPCRFYDEFGDVPEVGESVPAVCVDGSGKFARTGHVAVWTGQEMIVWGGSQGGHFAEAGHLAGGLSYQPYSVAWSTVPMAPVAIGEPSPAVWTGRELIVFGYVWESGVQGMAYESESGNWRWISHPPGGPRSGGSGVWTGSDLILWGGRAEGDELPRDGAAYDPVADTWHAIPPAPVGGRYEHAAVWTGEEMIVWGGSDHSTDLADGAAYSPLADTWRPLAPSPLSARQWFPVVWTGTEMIVWGGASFSDSQASGAAYDPKTDTWRTLAPSPLVGRFWHSMVWTGDEVIVWGGYGYPNHHALGGGASYDPEGDRWTVLPEAPIAARCHHTAVWTGQAMVVFGGYEACGSPGHFALGDGAIYSPETDSWTRVIPSL
jgi:hypothetical protein